MDDKTTQIPSLKEWEDRRAQRSAQSQRTGSMQTKGQMKRSASRQQAGAHSPQNDRRQQRSAADTQRISASTAQRRQADAKGTQRRSSASAPKTYARERNARVDADARDTRSTRVHNADYDASRRIERTQQAQRSRNISDRGGEGRPAGSSQTRSQSRTSSQQRSPQSRKQPPKKPARRPLSPRARKFRSICISVLIVLAVLVVGAILSLTVLFKTESINVKGAGAYSKQDIVSASGLVIGDNIFTSPKSRAEDKIETKFPYVEKAEVYSVFPNAINIDITLADPAYVIEGLGGFYVVSDKGKVLEVSSTDDEADIPIIEGVQIEGKPAGEFVEYDSELVGTALTQLFGAFKETGSEKITAINIEADGDTFSMKYVYDGRIVVYMGLPEHIDYKVQTAHTIIKEKIDIGGSMIAGDLDVSLCYDTMKSYFNQYTLLSPHVSATEPATEDSTEPETQAYAY